MSHITVRLSSVLRAGRRSTLVVSALCMLLLLALIASLMIGTYPLRADQLWAAATGELDHISQAILVDYRLPRILTAVLVGISFAMAGAIFQTLMRNPLASPDVVGFSAGAGVGALTCLMLLGQATLLIPFAVVGGLVTTLLVIALAWRGGVSTYRLILIGIGFNFVLTALLDLMLSRIDLDQAVEMSKWLAGTLNNASWYDVNVLTIGLGVLLPIALWLQFALNRLALGQDLATALGIRITPYTLAMIITGVVLTALAVSVAGPLPFIAFVAGPIARRLLNSSDAALFTAALVGALVTLCADACARLLGAWINIPTGVFTAFIGAPYLLWLLVGQIRRGQL